MGQPCAARVKCSFRPGAPKKALLLTSGYLLTASPVLATASHVLSHQVQSRVHSQGISEKTRAPGEQGSGKLMCFFLPSTNKHLDLGVLGQPQCKGSFLFTLELGFKEIKGSSTKYCRTIKHCWHENIALQTTSHLAGPGIFIPRSQLKYSDYFINLSTHLIHCKVTIF